MYKFVEWLDEWNGYGIFDFIDGFGLRTESVLARCVMEYDNEIIELNEILRSKRRDVLIKKFSEIKRSPNYINNVLEAMEGMTDRELLLLKPSYHNLAINHMLKDTKLKNAKNTIPKYTLYDDAAKKIAVLITAYKAPLFITDCLDSVITQRRQADRILVGIDGCEETLTVIKNIKKNYPTVEFYYGSKNNGTYMMMNALLAKLDDDWWFQRFDSDDVMNPDMLEKMEKYNTPALCKTNGLLFCKKEWITKIFGGYRDWRVTADSDLMFRIQRYTNMRKLPTSPMLFQRRLHPASLTQNPETGMGSEFRNKYRDITFANWKADFPQIYVKPRKSRIKKI